MTHHDPTRTDRPQAGSDWIGVAPTDLQIWVILTVAIMSSLMSSLLPILLGGLLREGRLSGSMLGQAATLELVVMGVVSGVAGAWLPARHLRAIGCAAGGALTAANLCTMVASGLGILASRALSGVGCGLFIWILVNMFARSATPAKWVGVYLVMQSIVSLLFTWLFTALLIPHFGINGCFAGLALLSATLAMTSFLLPAAFGPLGHAHGLGGAPPLTGMLALATAFFYSAGILAIWVYAEAILRQLGLGTAWVDRAFILGFVLQVAGAACAAWLGNVLPAGKVIVVGCAAGMATALLIVVGVGGLGCVLYMGVFAGLWMLVVPQVTPFVIAADSSRAAALQTGSAQAIGYAAGPAVASLLVHGGNVRPAAWAGLGLFAVAMLAAAALAMCGGRLRPGALPLDPAGG